jgi:hypothetical protein
MRSLAALITACSQEFTLDTDVNEYKYYCSGIGLVLEVDVNTGARIELIEVDAP